MLVYFFRLSRVSEPFNEYAQLEEMLALRSLGWSYTALADKYNVPKLTIRYLCRRFGLAGTVTVTTPRQDARTTTESSSTSYSEEEHINPGKSYAEYLQDERERKWRRLTRQDK